MRKIIITMVAIAFSLSAFSKVEIMYFSKAHDISLYCISGYVFLEATNNILREQATFLQVMNDKGLPLKCSDYKN